MWHKIVFLIVMFSLMASFAALTYAFYVQWKIARMNRERKELHGD